MPVWEDEFDSTFVVRPALPGDAQGIAQVLVETFTETYRGLIQDKSLNKLSVPGSSIRWGQVIAAHGSDIVLVAADPETGEVLGYAYGGSARDASLPDGELYQCYVHPKAQGRHIGRQLFLHFARTLWSEGYSSMIARVLDGTPAMHFYQTMQGIAVSSDIAAFDGRSYREILYRWPDLDEFMN